MMSLDLKQHPSVSPEAQDYSMDMPWPAAAAPAQAPCHPI